MIYAFAFIKVNMEKKTPPKGRISVVNNVKVTDVREGKMSAGESSRRALNMFFSYDTDYQPNAAVLSLQGSLLYSNTDEVLNQVMESWKNEQKLPPEVREEIMNTVIARCTIKSLILADNFNLPPPINLPRLDIQQSQSAESAQPAGSAKSARGGAENTKDVNKSKTTKSS